MASKTPEPDLIALGARMFITSQIQVLRLSKPHVYLDGRPL